MKYTALIISIMLLLLAPGLTIGSEVQCDNQSEVVVTAERPEVSPEFCQTAEKAIKFLANYGLFPQRTIRLRVVEHSISSQGYDAFGSYDSRNDVIELMSYQAIQAMTEAPEMYGEPFDPIHYLGAIAHEVAHAVMQHNLKTELISPAPQEYLAHTAQLAVMPQERREAIVAAMNVGPWEPGDAISDIYMAMQPGKFAVKSYRHLTTMKEPESFVRLLLNANWFYVYVPN